jgi:D-serine deaminase-like pyridoxal phosphate-dependent protein
MAGDQVVAFAVAAARADIVAELGPGAKTGRLTGDVAAHRWKAAAAAAAAAAVAGVMPHPVAGSLLLQMVGASSRQVSHQLHTQQHDSDDWRRNVLRNHHTVCIPQPSGRLSMH